MSARAIARGALIGALYALLTLVTVPLGAGVQLRFSEALCVLPYFCPEAVPGLFVGCAIANLVTGAVMLDVVFGSLATLAAAYLTYLMKQRGVSKWLAPLPAVVVNAVVVGLLLRYAYQVELPLWMCMAGVFAGQAVSCYGIGIPLWYALDKFGRGLFE
ncbi:MAG TPA: QueT transporter family protein [Clostridia bacterium]|nr:QueT transporter family protein [Clostridia bacterium]